jgi:hypothetical protein
MCSPCIPVSSTVGNPCRTSHDKQQHCTVFRVQHRVQRYVSHCRSLCPAACSTLASPVGPPHGTACNCSCGVCLARGHCPHPGPPSLTDCTCAGFACFPSPSHCPPAEACVLHGGCLPQSPHTAGVPAAPGTVRGRGCRVWGYSRPSGSARCQCIGACNKRYACSLPTPQQHVELQRPLLEVTLWCQPHRCQPHWPTCHLLTQAAGC